MQKHKDERRYSSLSGSRHTGLRPSRLSPLFLLTSVESTDANRLNELTTTDSAALLSPLCVSLTGGPTIERNGHDAKTNNKSASADQRRPDVISIHGHAPLHVLYIDTFASMHHLGGFSQQHLGK